MNGIKNKLNEKTLDKRHQTQKLELHARTKMYETDSDAALR